ncbi:MAG TPA: radical SAM protein [Vicinamibacterales bacterium]|jgi:MoaA/NifB/PqqE/SkfB family radical SAM enzyme|nr:radical SAM protein [Vicinamibacterales bacterium]
METGAVVKAWGLILSGYRPNLSVEITRECPLRCPGCYAYGDEHLGGDVVLRQLADFKGQELIDGMIDVVKRHKPLHLSIVGGEPLVRFRELEVLVPKLTAMGVHVQIVTSAVRPIPEAWAEMDKVQVCVSIDGLQPEHDARRAPATYDRILKHIKGQHITVHCTITRQQSRAGYVTEFTEFWAGLPDVKRIWFSLYTPQIGEDSPEMLRAEDRARVVAEITELYARHPKLHDMIPSVVKGYLQPPGSPEACIFAKTTACLSSDLKRTITPCQYGGTPDCTQCGCMASVGLGALGDYKLGGLMPLRSIFNASFRIGDGMRKLRGEASR